MFLCVGLDITSKHIPVDFLPEEETESRLTKFIILVINLTSPFCCSWKPNFKFYEQSVGRLRLEKICKYIKDNYPEHILIGDNKENDIGNTGEQVVLYYKELGLDAFTMNPLMGFKDSCDRFLANWEVGVFALCLTSNEGSEDFLLTAEINKGFLYEQIANNTDTDGDWNRNRNYHLVVGATNDPALIQRIRIITDDSAIFLMPGYGAQNANLKDSVRAGRNRSNAGILAVVARDIFASKLKEGESFEIKIIDQASFYHEAFKEAINS